VNGGRQRLPWVMTQARGKRRGHGETACFEPLAKIGIDASKRPLGDERLQVQRLGDRLFRRHHANDSGGVKGIDLVRPVSARPGQHVVIVLAVVRCAQPDPGHNPVGLTVAENVGAPDQQPDSYVRPQSGRD